MEGYYSSKEVMDLLNVSYSVLDNMRNLEYLKDIKVVGLNKYYNQEEVKALKLLYETTYGINDLQEYLLDNHSLSVSKPTIRNYLKKFEIVKSPFSKFDLRIRDDLFQEIVKVIIENYKPHVSSNSILTILKKNGYDYRIHFIEDKEENIEFVEYNSLKKIIIEFNRRRNKKTNLSMTTNVRYIVNVCEILGIKWYTDRLYEKIYISKADLKKYEKYFLDAYEVMYSGKYYSSKEVKKMFNILNVNSIAEYAGYKKINSIFYINKEKVDEFYNIINVTITTSEICKRLNICDPRILYNIAKQLNLKIYSPDEYPTLSNLYLISDIEKIINYLDLEKELNNARNNYERYMILIKNTPKNPQISKTYKLYEMFVTMRFKNFKSNAILKPLEYIYKSILNSLNKEIFLYTDKELITLIKAIQINSYKVEFTYFLNYCKEKQSTNYKNIYKNEATIEEVNPYFYTQWIAFAVVLFNENSTYYDELIKKAVKERTVAMSWLYCAMHYVCGWRNIDIINLHNPNLELVLNMNETEVIKNIEEGKFTINMAQRIVNEVIRTLKTFRKKPKKTADRSNSPLILIIEDSYVYIIGMLIALCESHRIRAEKNNKRLNSSTLITERATRKFIHELAFGEIYSEIFNDEGFTNIRATKTFLSYSQKISQENSWGIGMHISSVLRSHKIGKKFYAPTTQIYLEGINKSNNIDMITHAIAERGTFGFMPYLMLKMIERDDVKLLDIREQNKLIKEAVPFKNYEIEPIIKEIDVTRKNIDKVFTELLIKDKNDIVNILYKISNGQVPSKMEHSQCLLKCVDKSFCQYQYRSDCIGCEYLIPEIYFLIEFNNRIFDLLQKIELSHEKFEKIRYSHALKNIYLPILKEAVYLFGKDRIAAFINLDKVKKKIIELDEGEKLVLE